MDKALIPKEDFREVINLITKTRNRTLQNVNKELIDLYWQVGKYISTKAAKANWGKGLVKELSEYIKLHSPNIKGFTARNIWRMKQFYETYENNKKLSAVLTELSWTNNLIIMSRCKTLEEKEYYLKLCIKERYSSRELERQITTGIFERTKIAQEKLSPVMRELPQDTSAVFRDSYVFEFLDLPKKHSENDLQKALIKNLKDFILELGNRFTFVGEEYRVQVGNSDFAIDLLFFHRELQCLVAFELKIEKFKPGHMGQLEFYLEALDRDVKLPHENPSIGILLCTDKDEDVVEYTLSRTMSPTLIADYQTKLIPKEILQQKLHELAELTESEL